ncbi:MAG TPA: amidohydrolase family protein [Stellaceae bacterium]|nr:amidohydrolase family protein [Stellaceae bacterium]
MAEAAQHQRYERIAVEEGFTIPEIVELQRSRNVTGPPTPQRMEVVRALLDLGAGRIRAMDLDGIAKQVCVLAGAIIQDIDPVQGSELAALANDRLAEAAKARPDRITGLAAFVPRDPDRAARELERAVKTLGLKGGIVNSHSAGEYLDDRKFWPIFEAVQAMDVPIYIHPRDPSPQMFEPFDMLGFKVGWSWAVEVGTHIVRLIWSGVFDAFPRLRIVIGHMGEGLPFCLDRVDNRYYWELEMAGAKPGLKRKPSDYFRENVVVTTSGMNFAPPLLMTLAMVGIDNVLFAADYPFERVRDSVAAIDALPLADADKEKLLHRNATRVFAL